MRNNVRWLRSVLLVALAVAAASGWLSRESPRSTPTSYESRAGTPSTSRPDTGAATAGLPPEALQTLRLIDAGGPFPYDRDGIAFQNREGRLPERPQGYYREYTVVTPGTRDRGARRLVSGGDPPAEYFYTDDHYRTFRRIEAPTR
jgi:guanyl-specific ribonuclease Sa